jgi:acetyl-CoA synthetase
MTLLVTHMNSPVGYLAARPAVHVSKHDSLTAVSQVMRTNDVSAVFVDSGKSAVVTERDLVRALAAEYPGDTPIIKVATPAPLAVPYDMDIVDAAALMLNQGVRHLVVEFPKGERSIVSMREIAAALLQAAKPDVWLSSLALKVEIPTDLWLG